LAVIYPVLHNIGYMSGIRKLGTVKNMISKFRLLFGEIRKKI